MYQCKLDERTAEMICIEYLDTYVPATGKYKRYQLQYPIDYLYINIYMYISIDICIKRFPDSERHSNILFCAYP